MKETIQQLLEPETETNQENIKETLEPETENPQALHKNHLHHLLSNPRRRATLRYLQNQPNQTTTLKNMAKHIAAYENQTNPQKITTDQRKKTYVALYQTHLPKLNQHQIINYKQKRGTITTGPKFPTIQPYIGDQLQNPNNYITPSKNQKTTIQKTINKIKTPYQIIK